MKKLLISGLTIATLMTTLATSANAGYLIQSDYMGGYKISGTGSNWGSPTVSCRSNYMGGVVCN